MKHYNTFTDLGDFSASRFISKSLWEHSCKQEINFTMLKSTDLVTEGLARAVVPPVSNFIFNQFYDHKLHNNVAATSLLGGSVKLVCTGECSL